MIIDIRLPWVAAILGQHVRRLRFALALLIAFLGAATPGAFAANSNLTVAVSGTNVVLSWPSETGKTYTVQRVTDLVNESFSVRNLAAGIAATAPLNVFTTPIPGDRGFYRLLVEPDVPTLPATPYNYANVTLPDHFLNRRFPPAPQFPFQTSVVAQDNTPTNNPTTDAGATLGRVLFYDKKLSANGAISCGSCHIQKFGFSDPDLKSFGFEHTDTTRRHAMGLANVRFFGEGTMFWDARATSLEDQALKPFQDPVEMGLTLTQLVSIVQSQSYYPALFTAAFGDATVTTNRIARALAQFQRSFLSFNSRYDQARVPGTLATANFANFTAEENEGKAIFFSNGNGARPFNCAGCHSTEAFINLTSPNPNSTSTLNTGLDPSSLNDGDLGHREVSALVADTDHFKAPSLRNIAIRPPYMHDGRFTTLEQVVAHYDTGIQPHPQLDGPLRNPANAADGTAWVPARLNLTAAQRAALVAFLRTLTDDTFLTDPKFSNPFQ